MTHLTSRQREMIAEVARKIMAAESARVALINPGHVSPVTPAQNGPATKESVYDENQNCPCCEYATERGQGHHWRRGSELRPGAQAAVTREETTTTPAGPEERSAGARKPHRIDARRGATAEDVEFVIEAVEANFDLFASNMAALLQNLNENLPIGHGVNINSFLGTLADLRSDLTGDLMGAADNVTGE